MCPAALRVLLGGFGLAVLPINVICAFEYPITSEDALNSGAAGVMSQGKYHVRVQLVGSGGRGGMRSGSSSR